MGEEQAEEKKSKSPSLDSVFDEGAKLPKFGAEEAAPLPRLPSPNAAARSHAAYHMDTRQVDEDPIDWRRYVTPKDPGAVFTRFELEPGHSPEAPNAHRDRTDEGQRGMFWSAYVSHSHEIETVQTAVVSDYRAFMMAQENPELRALGFVMSSETWKGDASTLADQQKVGGNMQARDLFRGDGSLSLNSADERAIENAGQRVRAGTGAKQEHDDLAAADSGLRASMDDFEGAGYALGAGRHDVEKAEQAIERVKLQHEVAEDREKLEQVQQHVERVKAGIEFVAGGLVKFAVLGPAEAGDIVESIGAMASYAISRYSDNAIGDLEAKLAADTQELQTTEAREVHAGFEAAKKWCLSLLSKFKAERHRVIAALLVRQHAYNKAGKASASSSGGNGSSQSKISGTMAAIPMAELLLGMVKSIATTSAEASTKYSTMAGSGFHMALYDRRMQPTQLVAVLDQLEYLKIYFSGLTAQWTQRLASLQKAQTRLGGSRPSADIGEKRESETE